jgi:hypothetical protein
VEQVLVDAFTRAKDYQKAWAGAQSTFPENGVADPRHNGLQQENDRYKTQFVEEFGFSHYSRFF